LGRRSRNRLAAPDAPPARPRPPTRGRPRIEDRPQAPWGSFPLVELCVLLALGLGVGGFVVGGGRGRVMLACAAALGSLAGLELAIREHFAGYRSHTTVLAATTGIAVMAILFFARAPYGLMLVLAAAAFATAFWALRGAFRRRSGGVSFR